MLVLIAVSAASGLLAWLGARAAFTHWWARSPSAAVSHEVREHTRVRRFVRGRLDAEALTGLAMTLALAALVMATIIVALLVVLVRRSEALADLDAASARWSHSHAGPFSQAFLHAVTNLASTWGVITIGVAAAAIEWWRIRSRWIPVFLLVAIGGDSLATSIVKAVVDRARPTLDPAAASLGPSFPSGHSSTAAAMFAAVALLAGRGRSYRARAALVGVAVALAVAVAGSRVLLDLHWLSDVIGGLAFGWGWFAICAVAFGGWLLRLGAPVEQAATGQSAAPPAAQREADSVVP